MSTYDDAGQVTAAQKYDASGLALPAYGYHYQYDGIGNRTQATEGEAQPLAYHANLLNQYTNLGQNTIPLTGSASADATVTVKATVGETSTCYTPDRSGEAFAVDIPIPPGGGEVTTDLEINAVRFDSEQDLDLVKTVTGSYTASSQPMTYDADGNLLTWDGWLFTWNGENRLIRAEKGLLRIEADYDYMGRRFEKKVFQGETLTKHQRFIYDGYKLIEIRDALNENALETAYFWQPQALDVPIAIKQGTTLGFYQYDGNKNITGIKAQDGTVLAEYTYGPFGQTLTATGDWSALNPFRFSSEYHDTETGLIYYNYRHYSPDLGRWLSRDPIEESGGINLYAMLGNNLVNYLDVNGLVSLGMKIKAILGARAGRAGVLGGIGILLNHLSGPIDLMDDELEVWDSIPSILAELRESVNSKQLTNNYLNYELSRVNMAKKYGAAKVAIMFSEGIGSTGWLLNAASNVFIEGTYKAKCENGINYYKDVVIHYEWHDIIDGNSYIEAYRKGAFSAGLWSFISNTLEGAYDLFYDKFLGVDITITIRGTNSMPDSQFPRKNR